MRSGPFNGRHFAPVEDTASPPLFPSIFYAFLPYLATSPSLSPLFLFFFEVSLSRCESDPQPPAGGYQRKRHRTFFPRLDSIPFDISEIAFRWQPLCRRPPLFPMHMTVSRKTHCVATQALTSIFLGGGPFYPASFPFCPGVLGTIAFRRQSIRQQRGESATRFTRFKVNRWTARRHNRFLFERCPVSLHSLYLSVFIRVPAECFLPRWTAYAKWIVV